jgi:peptidyl-prolyl cis-trans isomerase A (cyclophilin A)
MRQLAWPLMFSLAACGGVPEEKHEAVVQQRDALRGEVAKLADDLDVARAEVVDLEQRLAKAKSNKPNRPPLAQVLAAKSQIKLADGLILKAVMTTSMGEIVCELWPELAPETVMNFVGLAEGTKEWLHPETGQRTVEPLYNGTKFHRVVKGFMIQGGDPLGTGTGGPGFEFGDEVWPDVRFDRPGLLAMANVGPNTNGSQFFITTSTPKQLNMRHTIFGHCVPEVALEISEVEVGGPQGSAPVKDVILEKLVIVRE